MRDIDELRQKQNGAVFYASQCTYMSTALRIKSWPPPKKIMMSLVL